MRKIGWYCAYSLDIIRWFTQILTLPIVLFLLLATWIDEKYDYPNNFVSRLLYKLCDGMLFWTHPHPVFTQLYEGTYDGRLVILKDMQEIDENKKQAIERANLEGKLQATQDILKRALDMLLPDGLEDPEGCYAEGDAFGQLFDEARRVLNHPKMKLQNTDEDDKAKFMRDLDAIIDSVDDDEEEETEAA